jgi:hypothetical protein
MKPKKLLFTSFLLLAIFTVKAQNRISNSGCVSKPKIIWGKVCGKNSLEAFWTNKCSEEIKIKMYILSSDGKWRSGFDYVKPGKTTSYFICEANPAGSVKWEVESRYNK